MPRSGLAARYPGAVAEAMEGFGVATAAALAGGHGPGAAGGTGPAFAELRTVSNVVGPRDRSAWRIDLALAALREAAAATGALIELA